MSELKFTHSVEFEALGMDDLGFFRYIPLHMLCLNEEEANTFAGMLERDKLQYSNVLVSELDEPIVEMMNEND
jgi:hypothetical protein